MSNVEVWAVSVDHVQCHSYMEVSDLIWTEVEMGAEEGNYHGSMT